MLKVKATSSSRVPIVSRSINIQKRQTVQPRSTVTIQPRSTGLRSDEILQERAALTRRPVPERQLFSAPRTQSSNIHERISRRPIVRRRFYDI